MTRFLPALFALLFGAAFVGPVMAQSTPILFVGSSIFEQWTDLSADMAPMPVVNRAVSGTVTRDWLGWLPQVIATRPQVVVYYCGSNDVSRGEPASAIIDRTNQFITRLQTALPGVRFVYMSINKAPEKQERWGVVDEVNAWAKQQAEKNRNIAFVDVNPALFQRDGSPKLDFYVADQLHLRRPAYVEFARILKPALQAVYAETATH